jgi:hypothetical protein
VRALTIGCLFALLWGVVGMAEIEGIGGVAGHVFCAKRSASLNPKNIPIINVTIIKQRHKVTSRFGDQCDYRGLDRLASRFSLSWIQHPNFIAAIWHAKSSRLIRKCEIFGKALAEGDPPIIVPDGHFVSRGQASILDIKRYRILENIFRRLLADQRRIACGAFQGNFADRTHISAKLPLLLVSDNPQLPALNDCIYDNEDDGENFKSLFFLFPTAICLATGAAIVAYGLFCCPTAIGVIVVFSAGIPIGAAVWLVFSKVLGF